VFGIVLIATVLFVVVKLAQRRRGRADAALTA